MKGNGWEHFHSRESSKLTWPYHIYIWPYDMGLTFKFHKYVRRYLKKTEVSSLTENPEIEENFGFRDIRVESKPLTEYLITWNMRHIVCLW